tara:strand:+ start:1007 stop:1141 length:135 start_codon:yes stop_codon:yes gene_type:complete
MKIQFRLIKTDTITGLEEAEWYKKHGWQIIAVGFNTIQFSKEVS